MHINTTKRLAAAGLTALLLSFSAAAAYAADTETTSAPAETTSAAETTSQETALAETTAASTGTTAAPDPLAALTWEEDGTGGIRITAYRWTSETEVEIPALLDGKPVTEIGDSAFRYCYADHVSLPETVTRIGKSAFEGCAYLQSAEIPASCEVIGASAFEDCERLESITVPETVREIGAHAFDGTRYYLQRDINYIILGDGILCHWDDSVIDGEAAEITIPGGVKTVGVEVFAERETLKTVHIPASVTRIQAGAFRGCKALETVDFAGETLDELAADAFADTSWRTGSKEDFLTLGDVLYAYRGTDTTVQVPAGIRVIGAGAFAENNAFTTLKLTDSVEEIRDAACRGCTSLQVATLGENIRTIGDAAFAGCTTLKYLRMGHQLAHIGQDAFAGCPVLEEVYLPDTLAEIRTHALGYALPAEDGTYEKLRNSLTVYANAPAARDYAQENGIACEKLPEEENTEPAPEVTTLAGSGMTLGRPTGTAWIPALILGGILLLAGIIAVFVRRKK